MRGKVGEVVFYRANGEQRQRAYLGSGLVKNPKTRAQQNQRTQLANLVAFYRSCKQFFKNAYENKPVNQTDYNRFVSSNLNVVKVYIPKSMASQDACVVAPYMISEGSLIPIEVTSSGDGGFKTNIYLDTFTIDNATTVGAFTKAVLANNPWIKEGMQLSYVSLVQMLNAETGAPYVSCRLYELTFNSSDESKVQDKIPAFGLSVKDKYVATGTTLAAGGFAYVLSQKDAQGKLYVSTQRVTMSTTDTLADYNSGDAMTRAADSYGVGDGAFLDPESQGGNSGSGGGTPVATSVSSVQIGEETFKNLGSQKQVTSGSQVIINGNGLLTAKATLFYAETDGGAESSVELSGAINTMISISGQLPEEMADKYFCGVSVNGTRYIKLNSSALG